MGIVGERAQEKQMGKIISGFSGLALAALVLILYSGQLAPAQDQKLDASEIAGETQRISTEGGELNIIWWLPEEFLATSVAANTNVNPVQVQIFIKLVHPYLIVGVVSGKILTLGPPTYRTEAEVRSLIKLKDNDGATYPPLSDDKVAASVPALVALVRPELAKMLGPLGDNMNFYVFPGSRQDGTRVCDPTTRGACEIDVGERAFKWKLPLESVLPKKKCPVCGEILNGTYKYCPYDGTSLAGGK
jgi:hypothetical protein